MFRPKRKEGVFSFCSQFICRIEDSPQQATGNLHRKDGIIIDIRSLTPPQAAGNALAYAVQIWRIDHIDTKEPDTREPYSPWPVVHPCDKLSTSQGCEASPPSRAGLPGKEDCHFCIAPLDPALPDGACGEQAGQCFKFYIKCVA
jgi:hypothetical protein